MTVTHVAGAIHADAIRASPQWLRYPSDPNELTDGLWAKHVVRDESGEMRVAGISVTELAERVGTPAYVYDEADFRERALLFRDAFAPGEVYYAGKAFLSAKVVDWVIESGLGIDVCTEGELRLALAAGAPVDALALHGNNKSDAELELAIQAGVGRIVVDSMDEIARIEKIAAAAGKPAQVLVRVTTGVEAHTHEYIATAHEDQKFGFSIVGGQALMALVRCQHSPHAELLGVHSHIGSQIFDTQGFEVAARRTLKLMKQFEQATGIELPQLDLGGGFGIAYTGADHPRPIEELVEGLKEIVEAECRAQRLSVPELSIEPGRAIAGPAAFTLYRVGTVKPVELDSGAQRLYVSVDGGMSDNIRPALYAAEYSAVIANRASNAEPVLARVVGKHCEGGDIVVRDVFLPGDIQVDDLIAVPGTGAYCRSMASNYNHVLKPPVVSVAAGELTTLLQRETYEDLFSLDPVLNKRQG